jgi:hypothetical protein
MHLRLMKMNGEIMQQTLTLNHKERVDNRLIYKQTLVNKFAPDAKTILDLESETSCLTGSIGLTQIPHLKKHLDSSEFGSIQSVKGQYDVIVSCDHLEYEEWPLQMAPNILSKLNPGGKWIVVLPIDNDVQKNYQARIHEFSNESAVLFASEISYDFVCINNDDSIVIVF